MGARIVKLTPIFRARLLVIVVMLLCFATSVQDLRFLVHLKAPQGDLDVYYTAASMVRQHQGQNIYSGADTGVDPQLRLAEPNTIFDAKARELGINEIHLYVYPPTLADFTVPLSILPITEARIVWKLASIVALLSIVLMLASMLDMPVIGLGSLMIAAFFLLFRPSLDCFNWGQVTILLAFCETLGMILYGRGHKIAATLFFAIAAAVKFTPLIVIVPLIAWRDWKSLRAFSMWCGIVCAGLWLVNGQEVLLNYVQHVLPSMSDGVIGLNNKNLSGAFRIFWRGFVPGPSPMWLIKATKVLSLLIILYAGWLSRLKRSDSVKSRLSVLALFWILSCCLAPVSWRHAYVLAIPAIVILGKRLLEGRLPPVEAGLLAWFVLSNNFGFNTIAQSTGQAILFDLTMMPPLIGVALVLMELHRLNSQNSFARVMS